MTESRQLKEALQKSVDFDRAVLDSLSESIVILDKDGTIIQVNEAWKRFGTKNNTTDAVCKGIGLNYLEVFRNDTCQEDEYAQKYLSKLQSLLEGTVTSFEMECPYHTSTEERWNLLRAVSLPGSKEIFIISHLDITNYKQAEREFRGLLESVPDATVIVDKDGKILQINAQTENLFGFSREELKGESVESLMPARFRSNHNKYRLNYLSNPRIRPMGTRLKLFGLHKDGREFPVDISLNSVKTKEGSMTIAAIRDITERIQVEEELRNTAAELAKLKNQLQQENIYLREEIELDHHYEEIIGESEGIRKVLSRVEQVAETESTVLLLGETGTGKELIARAIHKQSSRKHRAMVKVNCAALPPTIVESELFGREKGAYTGALTRQIGRFELADESTIFLDEISELPLELQAKLLRVVQEGEFERLGASKTIHVNVRIIAATNRNLAKAVQEGKFREDLYYRLNVFPISVPPLRDRSVDIPLLVWSFVKEFKSIMGKRIESIPQKTMDALQRYSWPGNIRELRNVIEQAMIISKGKILDVQIPGVSNAELHHARTLEDVERKHILEVLGKTGWRIYGENGAAKILGLKPTTLYSRMKRLGIKRPGNFNNISSQ